MWTLARRAGVSTSVTVAGAAQRGLDRGGERAGKIMKAVEALGYVLDQSAGACRSKRHGLRRGADPVDQQFELRGHGAQANQCAGGSGLQLLLGYTDYSIEKEEELIEVDAAAAAGRHRGNRRQAYSRRGASSREGRHSGDQNLNMPPKPVRHVVGFSNANAGEALVRYLHSKGYRKIGFIGGTGDHDPAAPTGGSAMNAPWRALASRGTRIMLLGTPPICR